MTAQEALKWIAHLFEESGEKITSETPRDAIPAWDSLGVLTLMAALDDRFEIVPTEQEMRGLKSVGDILDFLKKYDKLN